MWRALPLNNRPPLEEKERGRSREAYPALKHDTGAHLSFTGSEDHRWTRRALTELFPTPRPSVSNSMTQGVLTRSRSHSRRLDDDGRQQIAHTTRTRTWQMTFLPSEGERIHTKAHKGGNP